MNESRGTSSLSLERLSEIAQETLNALENHVVGQRETASSMLAAFMADGHVLLYGVPGIGKTLLARVFAACLGVRFNRVQFTPDLMPTDVVGTNVFEQSSGSFRLVKGPVFTQVLMADEVTRTPPKTQSALLESMQERQVTIDGTSYTLEPDFFVVATQNPIEFEGTYPLPEAQLDRFLVRIQMTSPAPQAEIEIYRRAVAGSLAGWSSDEPLPEPVMTPDESRALRGASRKVHVSDDLLNYLSKLTMAVRQSPHVELAISPRGSLSLLEVSRARALLGARDFVSPDDMKKMLIPCWGHRIIVTAESELEGFTAQQVIEDAAGSVDVPK